VVILGARGLLAVAILVLDLTFQATLAVMVIAGVGFVGIQDQGDPARRQGLKGLATLELRVDVPVDLPQDAQVQRGT